MMLLAFSARSDIGRIRENNEDNLYVFGQVIPLVPSNAGFVLQGEVSAPCVFAVCDGMGGQEHGEFASFVAASGILDLEKAIRTAEPNKIDSLVQDYVTKANQVICDKMREKSVRIGTTVALVIFAGNEIRPYNIGDSRIYALEGNKLVQISEDHTLAMQKVKMGFLSKEEARKDRDRNKLSRYLGIFEDEMVIEAEPLPPLVPGSIRRILITSDGLTDLVDDEKIQEILNNAPIKEAAELLVNTAIDSGGKDNVTCIVVEVVQKAQDAKPKGWVSRILTRLLRRQ